MDGEMFTLAIAMSALLTVFVFCFIGIRTLIADDTWFWKTAFPFGVSALLMLFPFTMFEWRGR